MSTPTVVHVNHLTGRAIVVTGAASGFGQLITEKSSRLGAAVTAVDVDEDRLVEVVSPLAAEGLRVRAERADVADLGAMRNVARAAHAAFGRIDIIVNNAGIMPLAFFSDHERAADAWHRAIDINIKGVLNGIAAVYDYMIAQGYGHVVNISSTYSNIATEGSGVYSATKQAVNALSDSLRVESQGKIKVSNVRPSGVSSTRLGASVVNGGAVIGAMGHHAERGFANFAALFGGTAEPALTNPNSIGYASLGPDELTDAVIYVMNQPWGICIGDVTIRASGEAFVM